MVAEALDIARETYLAILLDRAYGGAVLMGSPMGGVDIEEVAEKHPEQIFTVRQTEGDRFDLDDEFVLDGHRPQGGHEESAGDGYGAEARIQRQTGR